MRNMEWTNNIKIVDFCSQILVFQIEENFRNLLIFQFGQFEKFIIWKIPKICNLENSKICNLINSKNLQFGKFQKIPIWKISKNLNLKIYNNFQFLEFQKFLIWKIIKLFNFEK